MFRKAGRSDGAKLRSMLGPWSGEPRRRGAAVAAPGKGTVGWIMGIVESEWREVNVATNLLFVARGVGSDGCWARLMDVTMSRPGPLTSGAASSPARTPYLSGRTRHKDPHQPHSAPFRPHRWDHGPALNLTSAHRFPATKHRAMMPTSLCPRSVSNSIPMSP